MTEKAIGHGRLRLLAVQEAAITTPLDPYLSLRALAAYSGCSVRWLRYRLASGEHPLACYRLPGGKILVRRSNSDRWMHRYRQENRLNVRDVVAGILADLRGRPIGSARATGA